MWDFFISHASEDAGSIARPLALALQTYGFATWLDADALLPHDILDRQIESGLSSSQIIVLVLSSRYFSKEWTTIEMNRALELEAPPKCVVVPFLHDLHDADICKMPLPLRNRPGVSTRESIETAAVRLVSTIRCLRGESSKQWIHLSPDGWPIRHTFEAWLEEADKKADSTIEPPGIAWPSELFTCINRTKEFGYKLMLAKPDAKAPGWFDFQGIRLRDMDIQSCRSAPRNAEALLRLCPHRLVELATGVKALGRGYWYATYSGRTFLYLAIKQIYRTINYGAIVAGCGLPATEYLDDVAAVSRMRNKPGRLGSVWATSSSVADAIKPRLSGGDEISIEGEISDLAFARLGRDGAGWMDFFEDYLVPQIELRLFVLELKTKIHYSCQPKSWRFRDFKGENGEPLESIHTII
jgi:hypothetical protein